MFTYPPKPWVDGQVHQVVTEDGHYITGVYDMSSNTWNLHHGTSGGHAGLVMTPDVKTVNIPPDKPIPTGTRITFPTINNQQDVNWTLQKQIDDIRALTTSVWIGNSLEEPPLGQLGEVIYYLWYQTDNEILLHYSVQQQRYVPIEGEGAAQIAFTSIAPEFPSPFNAWFNVLSKEMHLAYNSQWWPISRNEDVTYLLSEYGKRVLNSDTAPTTGRLGEELKEGDFWYNTNLLELYIYSNGAWFPTHIPASGVSEEVFGYSINRIYSITDEIYLKNIEQDNRLDVVEENIVELEEEINAIAPSNERGEWTFNPAGVAAPSYYAFLDGSTQPTDRFDGAATIYVSTRDADNVTHSFANHEAGEYLQIFNKGDDGYGLYQITDIDDNSNSPNPFFAFTVDFVRSLVTVPKATGRGRFKFFTIADGDPEAYVLKTGDKMTGSLNFEGEGPQGRGLYIDARNASNLSGRAGLEIRCSGEKPLAITNSGSYQPTLEIYGYDSDSDNARKRNFHVHADGRVRAEGDVIINDHLKATELRSTKLTSGQNSNLGIYRGSGENEERKMLIGTDSINFDEDINLLNNDITNIGSTYSQYYRSHATTNSSDAFIRLGGTGGFLNWETNNERVAWMQAGGHLKGPSNRALEWNDTGVTSLRANNGAGSNGQVLTKSSSGIQWATPASGGGVYFGRSFKYSNQTSGTPPVGWFCFHSSRLWINETDLDGIQFRHTVGDYNWDVPFYVFSATDQHTLMASMLTTGSDYSANGYTKYVSTGWKHNSLSHAIVYNCKLTGLW